MKKSIIFSGMITLVPFPLFAMNTLPSNQAFTGLILTPNAQVVSSGMFGFTYAKGLPYSGGIADLDSLNFTTGLMKGLEVGGRIVTQDYNSNLFEVEDHRVRDLSASFKYQLPQFHDNSNLNFALGVQDLGGAANKFGAYYAVADYEFESLPIRTSLGYGSSEIAQGVLDGPFAGIEYQPLSYVQVTGEYDSSKFNSSLRLISPEGWLPYGANASLSYQLSSGHNSSTDMWYSHVQVPFLGSKNNQPYQFDDKRSTKDRLIIEQLKAESSSITGLTDALQKEGFLNIRLGKKSDSLVIALENRRYNHNQVDGLGVALGIISSHLSANTVSELGLSGDQFELISLVNDMPILAVTADSSCYRSFIMDGVPCESLTFITHELPKRLENVDWVSKKTNSGLAHTQVIFSPAIQHGVATEYGVYDYSLAMATNIYTPLWQGASLDIRHFAPLANSDDYDDGGYWQNSAYESEVDRILFHQAYQLPYTINTQFSLGLIMSDYRGGMNESQWLSSDGAHSLSLQLSHFVNQNEYDRYGNKNEDKGTRLAGYTFSKPAWDWQLNTLAGEFWHGDKGFKVTTSHWFSDVSVSAYYQRTQYDDLDAEQFVGVTFALPLTPWRDMSPGWVQFKGTEQFSYNVQTRVGESHNTLGRGEGRNIDLQHKLDRQYLNRGRFGTEYFHSQLNRLRNAYLRYLDTL